MNDFDFKSFGIGLLVGLVALLIVFIVMLIRGASQKRAYKKEAEKLKNTLATRMEIETAGVHQVKGDLETLKKENENMRITLSTLDQKAGRREIRQLQTYQIAVERLMVSSPGFAPAWQAAMSEAETALKNASTGRIPFVGKFISRGGASNNIAIENKSE